MTNKSKNFFLVGASKVEYKSLNEKLFELVHGLVRLLCQKSFFLFFENNFTMALKFNDTIYSLQKFHIGIPNAKILLKKKLRKVLE